MLRENKYRYIFRNQKTHTVPIEYLDIEYNKCCLKCSYWKEMNNEMGECILLKKDTNMNDFCNEFNLFKR